MYSQNRSCHLSCCLLFEHRWPAWPWLKTQCRITVRCKASPPEEDWRCNSFAVVEEQVEAELGIEIDLNLIQDNAGWGDYKNEFVLASEAGEAPDIILSGHEDIGAWAPAGFILPLDDVIGDA